MEEGDEIWIDQDLGLDEDTIRRIMRILIRSAIRHEQQLTILEANRSYVLFMETNSHGIIGLLTQASQHDVASEVPRCGLRCGESY